MATIAFIGLGNMGGPMAANLVKAGHTVRGFDLLPQHLEEAKANGLEIAASAAEAVSDVDAVITMLPAGKHVISVYEDIAPKARKDSLLSIAQPLTSIRPARHMNWQPHTDIFPSTRRFPAAPAARRQAPSPSWRAEARRLSSAASQSFSPWPERSSIVVATAPGRPQRSATT